MKSLMTYRIFGVRVFDIVVTVLALWLLFLLLMIFAGKQHVGLAFVYSLILALVLTFPLAIFFHAVFQIPTKLSCALKIVSANRCAAKEFK